MGERGSEKLAVGLRGYDIFRVVELIQTPTKLRSCISAGLYLYC